MRVPPRVELLSCPIHFASRDELIGIILKGMVQRSIVVSHQNLHGLFLLRRSQELRTFYNSCHLCYVDGMPIIWLAKLCGFTVGPEHRNTQLDWLNSLLEHVNSSRMKMFFLGGTAAVAERSKQFMNQHYPDITFAAHHGFLDGTDTHDLERSITDLNPDLLLIGMGMPNQELWLHHARPRLRFGVALTGGGIMDYLVMHKATPNRRIASWGLEWLLRFSQEPRRLGARYLLEPWSLLIPAMKEVAFAAR